MNTYKYIAIIVFIIWSTVPINLGTVDRNFSYDLILKNDLNITDLDIYRPYLFSVDDNSGNMAVYSYADHRAYIIFNDSKSVKIYGKGQGGGPEEFRNPTDIKFDKSGNFWIADPHLARISMWSPDSGLIGTINHQFAVPEKISVSEEFYVLKDQTYSPTHGLLRLYNSNTKEHIRFAKLPAKLTESALLMDSMISSDSERVYVTMLNAGLIYCFDRNGDSLYEISTIEPVKIAELKLIEINNVAGLNKLEAYKLPEETVRAVLDHDINESYLISLFDGTSKGVGHFIDIYDKISGIYLGSVNLEKVTDNYVIGIEVH
ncbi:MAG: hypothetical protein U5K31_13080 [Balneolaceae bacterium]|nr:hypothetical protein [Balneolaceae bacterium]